MFEKEAEDNKPPYAYCALDTKCELWKDGFQKGAEFGYNKAKVEIEEGYRESLCNSELNLASVTNQLEELEKANEWHKADEKPKVTKEYLVYLITGYNCRSVNMMIYNAERGFWCADNQSDVVYWKEIVLPKESE